MKRNIRNRNAGFALVELLVVLAFGAIMLNLAMPSFSAMISRHQAAVRLGDFQGAISLARSEALRTGTAFTVQATNPADGDNEFGQGWCVVAGAPGNCAGAIRTFSEPAENEILDGQDGVSAITFNSLGELSVNTMVEIDFCSALAGDQSVVVSLIGRVGGHGNDDLVVSKRPSC